MKVIAPFDKPVCIFGIEGTGPDPVTDRIVSIAILKIAPADLFTGGPKEQWLNKMVNPGRQMPDEVIAIHGITNEMVADCPPFSVVASTVHEFIKGCDLVGFGIYKYDCLILQEEFARSGIDYDPMQVRIVDVANIYHKKEPRDLAAALKFFTGKDIQGAHNAAVDVQATYEVLLGQLARYQDLAEMTVAGLAEFSKRENYADLAGKLIVNKDGAICYNIRPNVGVPIGENSSLAEWMLNRDFPSSTKAVLRKELDRIYGPSSENEGGCE